ncbi:MerR family transcriptional regulator [Microbacterium sp.]|uniref:helix-turn-helix domain-containing protein n=1 Tax=Microbacterium sp. TaxID=51671 RepID=UPI00261C3F99|nr:MerR family transcriptional regulator [Microbacterium sp.]
MGNPSTMHIGEVAERTSLSLRTLRHYDDIDLVTPSGRTDGGFRLYTEEDVARIMLIRRMKPLGYTLEQMRDVLAVFDALSRDPASAADREALIGIRNTAEQRREQLISQVAMADEFLDQLTRL